MNLVSSGLGRINYHLRNEDHRIRWVTSTLLHRTGLGRIFSINCGSYKLRFFPTAISLTKWRNPHYGREQEAFVGKILNKNDVVIDVGANIGTFSLACGMLVGEKGKVISIEPHPRIFRYLKKNIELNKLKNVVLINCAVGDKNGRVIFSNLATDDQNKVLDDDKVGVAVPMMKLDDLMKDGPHRIKLLKVDVEGYEKHVFSGASRILAQTEYIFFEVDEKHFNARGYSTSDLLDTLINSGFDLYELNGEANLAPLSKHFVPAKCMNLVAKKKLRFCP